MNGRPQCANFSQIFTSTEVYRGEMFTLSACVVGYDFGTTVGNVYARFLSGTSDQLALLGKSQYSQPVNESEKCSTLNYTVYTNSRNELLQISTLLLPANVYSNHYRGLISYEISQYNLDSKFGCVEDDLLTIPVFINISLFPGCPPGLTLRGDPPGCDCYSILPKNDFQCSIQNGTGYLIWNTTMWVNATFTKVMVSFTVHFVL